MKDSPELQAVPIAEEEDWDLGPRVARAPLLISQINREVFAGDKYPVRKLLGEIQELLAAVLSGNRADIRSEAEQVIFDLQHLVHCHAGFDFVPVGCAGFIKVLYDRLAVWEAIFAAEDVTFLPEFLRGGSNHQRPEKVARALALGRAHDALWRL